MPGGTVSISLVREADMQIVMRTSRTGNGAYAMHWYDSTADGYFVIARESASRNGISSPGTPGVSTFDVALTASGGGGTTIVASSYGFAG